jgi:hypothetical protein
MKFSLTNYRCVIKTQLQLTNEIIILLLTFILLKIVQHYSPILILKTDVGIFAVNLTDSSGQNFFISTLLIVVMFVGKIGSIKIIVTHNSQSLLVYVLKGSPYTVFQN